MVSICTLELLQRFLGLLPPIANTSCKVEDVVFISIALAPCAYAYFASKPEPISDFQFGVCVFDTKDLCDLPVPAEIPELETFNFSTSSRALIDKYIDEKYLFGHTTLCNTGVDISFRVKKIFDSYILRKVVLVGDGLHEDLQDLDSSFWSKAKPIFAYRLDTADLREDILDRLSSRGHRNFNNLPSEHTFVAGNEANFTLRALLLLAVESFSKLPVSLAERERLDLIESIAWDPLPAIELFDPRRKNYDLNPDEIPRPSRMFKVLEELETLRCQRWMKNFGQPNASLFGKASTMQAHLFRSGEVEQPIAAIEAHSQDVEARDRSSSLETPSLEYSPPVSLPQRVITTEPTSADEVEKILSDVVGTSPVASETLFIKSESSLGSESDLNAENATEPSELLTDTMDMILGELMEY